MEKVRELELTEDLEVKPSDVFAFMAQEVAGYSLLNNEHPEDSVLWNHLYHDCLRLPGSLSKRWDKGFYWVITPSGTYMAEAHLEVKAIEEDNKNHITYKFQLQDDKLNVFMIEAK